MSMHFLVRRRTCLVGLLLLVTSIFAAGAGARPTRLGTTVGAPAALAAEGTPIAGKPGIILAEDRPRRIAAAAKGSLRLAGPAHDPPTLDPAFARDLHTSFLCRQLFRGLTRLDASLAPVPELAERIEIAPDGLTYTFRLRPDATFQDGRPIVADDVVFSLTRALDPATAGGDAALLGGTTYLSDIVGAAEVAAGRAATLRGARALDARTVELRLVAPRATFLMKLAGAPASIVDHADVDRGGEWWRSPNGSGPFRLASWEPGESLTLAAVDGFFAGPPAVAEVDVRLGPGAALPYNLYQAGEIDVAPLAVGAVERALDPDGGFADEARITPAFAVSYLAFRLDVAPMDDRHVRRAVQLAFPRHKVAAVTHDGHRRAADGLLPPGLLGRDWPVTAEPYDLAAARAELAKSSYGSASAVPPIRIYGAGTRGAEAVRDVLARDLGLRVDVVSVAFQEFNDGLARRAYPAYEHYWGADFPDPESFLWSLFGADSPDNYVAYQNEVFDARLRDAVATLDTDRRADLYARAHQALVDDDVFLPIYHDVGYTLVAPRVRGLELTPLGILHLDDVRLEPAA